MKITVIVPTFNRSKTLPYAIRSLIEQRGDADLDILVVDDGSTDDTPDILADLSRQHRELRVVSQPNSGVTMARNTGIVNLHPEAEFVPFLDSDDLSPEGRFAADLPKFRSNPLVEITYGRMMYVDNIDYTCLRPQTGSRTADIIGIHLSCAIFQRSLIKRIGLFDPEMLQGEDTDYLLRVFEANTRFCQTDTQCPYYFRHPDSLSKDIAAYKRNFALAIRKCILRRKPDPSIAQSVSDLVQIVKQENQGPGAASSRGMGLLTTPLGAFLNADDIWLPSKMSRQIDILEKCRTWIWYFQKCAKFGTAALTMEPVKNAAGSPVPC